MRKENFGRILLAILAMLFGGSIRADVNFENLITLTEYVGSLKRQISIMEKSADGDNEDPVYVSPIKVKIQAAVKKSANGGVEFYVFELGGDYQQTVTQEWEFTVSNKPGDDGFRANVGSEFLGPQSSFERVLDREGLELLIQGTEPLRAEKGLQERKPQDELGARVLNEFYKAAGRQFGFPITYQHWNELSQEDKEAVARDFGLNVIDENLENGSLSFP